MEVAATLFSSLASSVSTVGGAAASAAGAAGSTGIGSILGSAGSLVGTILSGGASLLQMRQMREAGQEKALSYNLAAEDTKVEIGQENLKANERRNSLRQQLLASIGERDAAYAASGADLSFGTPAVAREQAVTDAERALAIDNSTTASRVTRLNERADNLRYMARSASRTSGLMADLVGIEAAGRVLRRG